MKNDLFVTRYTAIPVIIYEHDVECVTNEISVLLDVQRWIINENDDSFTTLRKNHFTFQFVLFE